MLTDYLGGWFGQFFSIKILVVNFVLIYAAIILVMNFIYINVQGGTWSKFC